MKTPLRQFTALRRFVLGVSLVLAILPAVRLPAAEAFTAASYTFNQTNTPNHATLLGNNAVLGGATFGPGYPTTVSTFSIGFPGSPGLNTSLSLASLTMLGDGTKAVNLPNGNVGTTTRHGIEVFWDAHRGLPNSNGVDFVIYESASATNAVEGVMARVHRYPHNTWSAWFYFAPDAWQTTAGVECFFAYGFDLSEMGMPADTLVDRIQFANLVDADRVMGAGTLINGKLVGEGKVVFDASNNVLPDPGQYATKREFDSGSLDPDPIYVAALHSIVSLPPKFRAYNLLPGQLELNVETGVGIFALEYKDQLGGGSAWQSALQFTNYVGGAMWVTSGTTNATRFFRLRAL